MIRNNTQYLIGFIDSATEEFNETTQFLSKLNGYEINITFREREKTEVRIDFNVHGFDEDFKTMFAINEFKTTKANLSALILQANEEIVNKLKELQII